MKYFDYINRLSTDSISLNEPDNYNFRCLWRLCVLLGRYFNSCILQFNRIESWASAQKKKGSRIIQAPEIYDFSSIYTDMHFLIISMERCYKLEAELYRLLWGDKKKREFLRQKEVKDTLTMRNTLEHMEEYINKDSDNTKYELPESYAKNGFSWAEKQLLDVVNGVFTIKDKKLVVSKTMFNHINEHMQNIFDEVLKRFDKSTH